LFLGLERPGILAVASAIGQFVVFGAVLIFVRGRADLFRVPVIQAGGELVTAAVLVVAARGVVGRFRPRARLGEWRAILAQSLPIAVADVTRTVVFSFDVLLIGLLLGEAAVGRYVAAYRLLLLVLTLGGFYYTALMPSLTRAFGSGRPGDAAAILRLAARGATLLTAPVAVGGVVLATPLLTALYGADYAAAAPAFRVLAPTVVLV